MQMTDLENSSSERKREKAKELRYRKPIVKDLNLWQIMEELNEIMEECDNVRWFWEGDDETLLNSLAGDEDDSHEFKMMFADLCAECERMQEDLTEGYVPECFDLLFVAADAGGFGGGYLGWDSYEQDYFGIDVSGDFLSGEAEKKLKRLTKEQLIGAVHICLKVLCGYLGLKNRYDNLKAALDIVRDENTGYLKMVTRIGELYDAAESEGFYGWKEKSREYQAMLDALPQEVWLQ